MILAFLALAACSNSRQPPAPSRFSHDYRPPRDENYHGGPAATILKYDANHDGAVTRAELEAGLHAEFDSHDTGHTGCLTPDQIAVINAERIAADQSAATPLQDFRQNGCVDFSEFASAPLSVFDDLDRNNDGTVSAQELNPRAGQGAGAGNGQERRGNGANRPRP
jgi:hypothetical protein